MRSLKSGRYPNEDEANEFMSLQRAARDILACRMRRKQCAVKRIDRSWHAFKGMLVGYTKPLVGEGALSRGLWFRFFFGLLSFGNVNIANEVS